MSTAEKLMKEYKASMRENNKLWNRLERLIARKKEKASELRAEANALDAEAAALETERDNS